MLTKNLTIPSLTNYIDNAKYLLNNSKSTNTIKAYQSDWVDFANFCNHHNLQSLPASIDTLSVYVSYMSQLNKSYATVKRRMAAINKAHVTANEPSPTKSQNVKELLHGYARIKGRRQKPKKALIVNDLKLLIDKIDSSTIQGKRDKALLLLGFSLASRRSELVSINVSDIEFTPEGADIQIYEEKNKRHILKSILSTHNNYCPVSTLRQWLDSSNITTGAVFVSINKSGRVHSRLSTKSVANIVKHYATLAGLDHTLYASHSLRSGLVTSAAMAGYNTEMIMQQTGHATREMVDRYVQHGNRYSNNITAVLRD